MKQLVISLSVFLLSIIVFAQEGNPTDYLTTEFHKNRREAFRKKMPNNSVAVLFANPIRNRANDVNYIYHQDPNFYYLTGYKEPHAVLVIFSENQTNTEGIIYNEMLFVQGRNARMELYDGNRLGVEGAKNKLGFEMAYFGEDFENSGIDYSAFDKVMFFNFENDYRKSKREKSDLYSLVETFKKQANYKEEAFSNPMKDRAYQMIKESEVENSDHVVKDLGRAIAYYPELKEDKIISEYVNTTDNNTRIELKQQVLKIEAETPKSNLDIKTLSTIMGELRQIKTPEEMVLLTKAVRISAMGQREVMKAIHPKMSETEIQGVHEFVYKKYGSEYEGYPSIVGSGNNACVLHYIDNSKMHVENELVLMDLGAEYHGYTADVTRTIPANGKFTKEQKIIYDLVYEAQEAGIAAAVVGNPHHSTDTVGREIITKGLMELGVIKSEEESRKYFPHGTSHYIGLDVHDAGLFGPFQANMVITVEPGIYIPKGSDCDEKWWGIGVRIEDDILITENGPINLSAEAPRKSEDIEKLMKEKSVLEGFILPDLD
ncbi:aminopeptidase P family protein [Xanthomarina sp. F2636L]|uniref:aminopeptidase P family protein n=1 Tax=Xanthomarina sp. F2636L TaxID=2996018 RepID=UPI00225E663F|nr:aminopeptidase P family protein [Xanthomarina sp. F2636L]MCX7549441.1 aminopeptidase P N-terminal domain-containing protein [Xanthomarina sp. F2636L]